MLSCNTKSIRSVWNGLNCRITRSLLYIIIFNNIRRSAESRKFNLSFTQSMIKSCILPKHNRSSIFRTKLWDSRKILKWNLQKQGGKAWTGIHLDQDRDKWWTLVNTVTDLQASVNAVNFLTKWETFRFWRRTALHGNGYNMHADVNNRFN